MLVRALSGAAPAFLCAVFACVVVSNAPALATTPAPMVMPSGMTMGTPTPAPPLMARQGPLSEQDIIKIATTPGLSFDETQWSEFNHRVAGLFVFVWGLTGLIAGLLWPKKTWWRFVPPLVLLGLAEFLILRNDPKAWPIGPIPFWISFRDASTLEHRVFVLLIIALGVIELLRAGDRLPPFAFKFAVPAVALTASIMLLFHHHGGFEMQQAMQNASDPSMSSDPKMRSMLASMALVKSEHLVFAIAGFGFAASKLGADMGWIRGRLGQTLWAVFATLLGLYMFGYSE